MFDNRSAREVGTSEKRIGPMVLRKTKRQEVLEVRRYSTHHGYIEGAAAAPRDACHRSDTALDIVLSNGSRAGGG